MKIDQNILANAPTMDLFSDLPDECRAEAEILAKIAVCIHNKRLEMDMSQAEFGKYMNVSQTMVSKWESGDYNFSLQSLVKILSKLDLELEITDKEQRRMNMEIKQTAMKLALMCNPELSRQDRIAG